MKREPSQPGIFVGNEVENTPARGMRTLFVAGVYNVDIIKYSAHVHGVEHIYLGANQCVRRHDMLQELAAVAQQLLVYTDYKVTLDFPLWLADVLTGYNALLTNENFIPMLSMSARHIERIARNPNATLKLDDDVRDVVNTGVWCHPVKALLSPETKTEWSAYKEDKDV